MVLENNLVGHKGFEVALFKSCEQNSPEGLSFLLSITGIRNLLFCTTAKLET